MTRDDSFGDSMRAEGQDAASLRAEIDRLRLAKQELLAEIEEIRTPGRAVSWLGRRMWRATWQQFYIARWHLLHRRQLKAPEGAAERYDPYEVRVPRPALPDRPRILHCIGNFHTGGSARLIVDLVEHLGHRFEQQIVVRSLPARPAYTNIDPIRVQGVSVPRRLRNLLRQFRPDVVHVHMLGHQQDEYGQRDWSWYHDVFRAVESIGIPCIENINIPVEPYVSPAVRCYVHVSDDVRDRFGRLDAWNETIHPGSDLEMFSRPADLPVPDDSIGMVYRLQPDKLDERSIEPFIEVVRRRPATRVTIVGGGQYLELYRSRVAAAEVSSAFTFTGYVSYVELPAHLARMSVFVAPVHTESFGQVSPFAMGMGLPVAGYDVGALREITAAPELLAPAGDAVALAEIVIGLLDDRERRLRIGEENRRRARSRFSVQATVRRYEALYDEILASPGTSRRGAGTQRLQGASRASRGAGEAPGVSVVMAVRDGERFLREAIESVLTQTYAAFELIIIDDASTDRTRAIIESYGDRRIRLLVNEEPQGLSRSLNRGIREARGRFIARLDADDVAEPERLALQLAFLDRRPEFALVGSWYTIIDEHGRETGRRCVPGDHHEIRWMLGFCNAFAHSAVMIRKAALDVVGLYDESLVYAMDYDLWLRIAARMRVGNYERFLLRWRMNPRSLTARLSDRTERVGRVTADLARRLGWPADSPEENERKAELLTGIVAGSPADMSLDDAAWAVETLRELLEQYCREHPEAADAAPALRGAFRRETARSLLWMAHHYPDRRDARYAWRALGMGAKVDRRSLVSREAASLLLKLLGGRTVVSTVRSIAQRTRGPSRA